jgi:hypothetical protein
MDLSFSTHDIPLGFCYRYLFECYGASFGYRLVVFDDRLDINESGKTPNPEHKCAVNWPYSVFS